jgi:hypothetical protein
MIIYDERLFDLTPDPSVDLNAPFKYEIKEALVCIIDSWAQV